MPLNTDVTPGPCHVFVYGTLRRGGRNDINRLQPMPRYVGMGSVAGRLFRLGWYPGLRLGGAGRVVGEVYEINAALETVLDTIEGLLPVPNGEYAKRCVPVPLLQGTVQCLVYEVSAERARAAPCIHHGDWMRESVA